ncbi:hypothetical protein scyTo_0026796, partial [Scyliorhinus torazame]|nr:hypothetical protein [Scyliorhinus torazame]
MRHRPQDVILDEEEEDEDEDKRIADISSQGTVVIEGVEYKIERVDRKSEELPSTG